MLLKLIFRIFCFTFIYSVTIWFFYLFAMLFYFYRFLIFFLNKIKNLSISWSLVITVFLFLNFICCVVLAIFYQFKIFYFHIFVNEFHLQKFFNFDIFSYSIFFLNEINTILYFSNDWIEIDSQNSSSFLKFIFSVFGYFFFSKLIFLFLFFVFNYICKYIFGLSFFQILKKFFRNFWK